MIQLLPIFVLYRVSCMIRRVACCIMIVCALQYIFPTTIAAQKRSKSKGKATNEALTAAPTENALLPQIFTLKNGLRVLLFEDPTERTTTMRLQVESGTAADIQDREGTAQLVASWLHFNALASIRDVAPPLDTTITRFTASAGADALTLTLEGASARFPTLLTILAEAAFSPVFLRSDMETLREHLLERVRFEQMTVDYLVQAMSARVLLGETHPYSRRAGETSVQALNIDDVKDFHSLYFLPNNASLAVVGNVSKKELQPLLERAFKNWKQGTTPRLPDFTPRPLPQGIYLVEAPKAQYTHAGGQMVTGNHIEYSSLEQRKDSLTRQHPAIVFASLGAPIGAFDEEAMLHALRAPDEQHIPNKFATLLVPTFIANTTGFDKFLSRLSRNDHPVQSQMPSDSLFPARQLGYGQHTQRLLDSSRTRAVIVQNSLMNGIKPEYVLAMPERIKAVAASDMREAAQKYLGTERLTMIVIGSPDLLNPLVSLGVAQSRVVFRFSENLEPILTFEKSDLTLSEIFARHLVAIGGTTAVASLQSLASTSELQLSAMGQKFPGTIITKQKLPNKITRILEIPATQMLQALWYDGTKAFDKIEMMGNEQPIQQRQAKETESALFDAQIFPLLNLQSCGFTAELLGKREGQFIIKASAANGTVKVLTIDETTYFLTKIEETRQTPQGIVKSVQEFRDYEKVSGVQLPSVIVLRTGPGTLVGKTKYQVNPVIQDEEFLPK